MAEADDEKEDRSTDHTRAFRSKGDHIGTYLRPRGIRVKYHRALRAKGVTMRQDLQKHVERTIREYEERQ